MSDSLNENMPRSEESRRRRRGGSWQILLPFLAAGLVQNWAALFSSQAWFLRFVLNYTGQGEGSFGNRLAEDLRSPTLSAITLLLYASICVIWFGIWYRREFLRTQKPARDYACLIRQYRHWKWGMMLPGILVFALGAQYLATYFMNTLAALAPEWLMSYQQLLRSSGMDRIEGSLLIGVYVIALGPICEELCFRGLTMGYARRQFGFWTANVLQAFLFGLFHMNLLQGSMAFLLGLSLGFIKEKSQNLTLVMILHILFNAISALFPELVITATNPVSFFACLFGGLILSYAGLELLVRGSSPRILEVD